MATTTYFKLLFIKLTVFNRYPIGLDDIYGRRTEFNIINIENQGPHLPQEQLKKTLHLEKEERFGDQTSQTFFSLQASHEILRSHGGDLEMENIYKNDEENTRDGVRFTIKIPTASLQTVTKEGVDHGEEKNTGY